MNKTAPGTKHPLSTFEAYPLLTTTRMPRGRAKRPNPRVGWCFTINNPTQADYPTFDPLTMNYLVYQLEQGEQGTPHLQGYVTMIKRKRIGQMAVLFPRAHLEGAKGTARQNKHYCTKPHAGCDCKHCVGPPVPVRLDGPWEYGIPPSHHQGDVMTRIYEEIKRGTKLDKLIDKIPQAMKHIRAIEKVQEVFQKKAAQRWRSVTVEVMMGPPGSGKTRTAVEEAGGYDECFILSRIGSSQWWWDGYEGENTLILDDYDPDNAMAYAALLRVLDGHPIRTPVKGGFAWPTMMRIVITTNTPPAGWYPKRSNVDALMRRITRIRTFDSAGEVVEGAGESSGGGAGCRQVGNNRAFGPPPASSLPRQDASIFSYRPTWVDQRSESEISHILSFVPMRSRNRPTAPTPPSDDEA